MNLSFVPDELDVHCQFKLVSFINQDDKNFMPLIFCSLLYMMFP